LKLLWNFSKWPKSSLEPIPVGIEHADDHLMRLRGRGVSVDHEGAGSGRRLAAAGRALGEDGAAAAATAEAPAGLPQPARAGPGGDGRDLLRAAHRLPVERAERDRHLLVVLGPPPLRGVGRGRRVPGVLAAGPAGLRRGRRHRLGVAGAGRGDGQGAAGRGEKPARTRPTGASGGRSGAC
jgi:hypothetical protein